MDIITNEEIIDVFGSQRQADERVDGFAALTQEPSNSVEFFWCFDATLMWLVMNEADCEAMSSPSVPNVQPNTKVEKRL